MAEHDQDPVKAYNARKKKQDAADEQEDAADARRLQDFVFKLTGEKGQVENLRVTVSVSGGPVTFTFFNTDRRARAGFAVVWECSHCHQPVKRAVATAADVGELIVEGFPHNNCKPAVI